MERAPIARQAAWAILFALAETALRAGGAGLIDGWYWGLAVSVASGFLIAGGVCLIPRPRATTALLGVATLIFLGVDTLSYLRFSALGSFSGLAALIDPFEFRMLFSATGDRPIVVTVAYLGLVAILVWSWKLLDRLPIRSERITVPICVIALLFSAGMQLSPPPEWGKFWATRIPVLWLLAPDGAPSHIRSADAADLLAATSGHARPQLEAGAPLCSRKPEGRVQPGRSVILLSLEGIDRRRAVDLPNLERIAADSVDFQKVWVGNHGSAESLAALFAGAPPFTIPAVYALPQPQFTGLPKALHDSGYATLYLHGGDLSARQQRRFLETVGFETIVDAPVEANGRVDDEQMYVQFREKLEQFGERPYFATFATLNGRPGASGLGVAYDAALKRSDQALAEFYTWYRETEYDRGTVLLVVGHTAYRAAPSVPEDFEVPLLLLAKDLEVPEGVEQRRASHADVPSTIRSVLGLPHGRCEAGVSLLEPEVSTRRLQSLAVGQPSTFHVRSADGLWTRDLGTGRFTVKPASATVEEGLRIARYTHALDEVSRWVIPNNAVAPEDTRPPTPERAAPPKTDAPLYIAHRAQSTGPLGPSGENRPSAIRAAIDAGFSWVELDLGVTRDAQVVLVHDSEVDTPNGKRWIAEITLAELRAVQGHAETATLKEVLGEFRGRVRFLLEAKPTGVWQYDSMLARELTGLLEQDDPSHFLIDSFDPATLALIRKRCPACRLGWDPPSEEPVTEWILDSAAIDGMQFVIVRHDFITPEVLRQADVRGLQVLIYTINDRADLAPFSEEMPAGVLTDTAAVLPSD